MVQKWDRRERNVSGSTVSGHDKIQVELTRGVVKAEKKKALEVGRLKNQEHRVLEGSSKWRRVSLRIVKEDAERKIQSRS